MVKLWQRFKTEITKQSLNDVWDMEMELLPILIETRRKGIRVDEENNLLLVKGPVPGASGGDVLIRPAVKSRA